MYLLRSVLFMFVMFSAESLLAESRSVFGVEKELGARKLVSIYNKKYKMNLKIKRENGELITTIGEENFFKRSGKITQEGARFVRKLSHYLCGDKSVDCKLILKSHHFEGGYVSRASLVKKSQSKLFFVADQIFKASVNPSNVAQFALGDSQPLKGIDKNNYASQERLIDFNTRFEIKFAMGGVRYD